MGLALVQAKYPGQHSQKFYKVGKFRVFKMVKASGKLIHQNWPGFTSHEQDTLKALVKMNR
jgi:hypothetical protein